MIIPEQHAYHFKEHIATLTDYGNIKILDFKNPKSNEYRIRFLFEEDYYRLNISGDLGELIATNCNNMRWDKFSDFTHNVEYFESKIDCHSRPLYSYDEDLARKELKKIFDDNDIDWSISIHLEDFDSVEEVINEILIDYGQENSNGVSEKGYQILAELFDYACGFAYDLGKQRTGILELYMYAFKLAVKQLEGV